MAGRPPDAGATPVGPLDAEARQALEVLGYLR
jgi:hypothetical protein